MKLIYTILLLAFFSAISTAQEFTKSINFLQEKIDSVDLLHQNLLSEIEIMKLKRVRHDLKKIGLPEIKKGDVIINHTAMTLCYSEEHEQAKWVAHIITPEVIKGGLGRSNDFRVDSLVPTGTAVKADYWYSGFDRGHLAPSADFRWSRIAMSESYLYSNMAPQRPELNRERWAELEDAMRQYVVDHKEQIYLVTGGVLKKGLPKMGKKNKITIPEYFYKVAIDVVGDTIGGIGFILPNETCENPVMSYAVSIDSVEKLTGINFFPNLDDSIENKIESEFDVNQWQNKERKGNVLPIHRTKLPKKCYNTVQARSHYNEKGKVCGTVVAVKVSAKGNTFLNFDQKFPNQLFTCTIWQRNAVNFSFDIEKTLINQKICVKENIKKSFGLPAINLEHEEQIIFWEDIKPKKK